MKILTFTGTIRAEVLAILNNERRYLFGQMLENVAVGDVLCFISNEADANSRLACFRIVTDSASYGDFGSILSLRPLHKAEKEALKTEDSAP